MFFFLKIEKYCRVSILKKTILNTKKTNENHFIN